MSGEPDYRARKDELRQQKLEVKKSREQLVRTEKEIDRLQKQIDIRATATSLAEDLQNSPQATLRRLSKTKVYAWLAGFTAGVGVTAFVCSF